MGSCSIFHFSQELSWFSVVEIVTVSWDDLKGPLDVRPHDNITTTGDSPRDYQALQKAT